MPMDDVAVLEEFVVGIGADTLPIAPAFVGKPGGTFYPDHRPFGISRLC